MLYKARLKSAREFLALAKGLNNYSFKLNNNCQHEELIRAFVSLTRPKKVGIVQDGKFLGFTNYNRINDTEAILQNIFDEINLLAQYFEKKEGYYFDIYGNIPGILKIQESQIIISTPPTQKAPKKKELTELEKNLILLKLKELPVSRKELKKIFFGLAVSTHPDKFEHVDKGTRTEIAIIDKFRDIHNAYEYIEKELEKLNR